MIEMILGTVYIVIITCVVVSMTVLLLKGKKSIFNLIYGGCQLSAVIWCFSQVMLILSRNEMQYLAAYQVGNFGICFIGSLWLLFCISYNEEQGKLPKKWLSLCVVSALFYLCSLTNDLHHLYYQSFSMEQVTYGPLFFGNVTYTYVCVFLGCILLLKRKNLAGNISVSTAKAMIVAAALVPILLNTIHLFGHLDARFDVTPLGFGISTILVLFATIRYRFLEVNITAFDTVIQAMNDGVMLFSKGQLTYTNEAAMALVGRDIDGFDYEKWQQIKDFQLIPMSQENVYFQEGKNRYLHVEELCQENKRVILVIKDVSQYYELLEKNKELAISNEKYELSKERNRIAQEVHDTTGHTLVMIQSLLKLCMLEEDNKEYLEQAKGLAQSGLKELRQSINRMRQEEEFQLVTQAVMQLAGQVKEIPVEVTVQGQDSEQYSYLTKVIYDTLRESITNCLKYAHASHMEVILRFTQKQVELLIVDDGQGCEVISDNNGLRGIRERIEGKKGTVRFVSGAGEGFMTKVVLPVE